MDELIAIMSITVLAVISPGSDFAMVSRNSYLYGKKAGMLTAIGIATAVWVHVFYTVFGVSILLITFPILFHFIKILGACYLIYIGIQTYRHPVIQVNLQLTDTLLTSMSAFKIGFITNAFNPKTTLFVLSTFTQMVNAKTSLWIQLGYGAFMSLTHLMWFALVALLLSQTAIRHLLLAKQVHVNRIIGVILVILGSLLLI